MGIARILVFHIGSIGDTVISIPSLMAIRRYYGDKSVITLLHETRQKVRTNPEDVLTKGLVDKYIAYPFSSNIFVSMFYAMVLCFKLRIRRFQVIVYLLPGERSSKQIQRDKNYFRFCGIPDLIGFHDLSKEILNSSEPNGHPALIQHEAFRRLERLRLNGIDTSIEERITLPLIELPLQEIEKVVTWLNLNRQKPNRPLVAICPGTKQKANSWPVNRFVEIGRELICRNTYELLIIGGPSEAIIGDDMVDIWGEGLNAAGLFTVLGSTALLSNCLFMIGLDTGTTHLAAAVGTPCIGLYGERENPGQWDPIGNRHIVIRHRVSCAGCRLSECNIPGHPCMTGITVGQVKKAIQQMEQDLKIANL